jgi:hypothetical protein
VTQPTTLQRAPGYNIIILVQHRREVIQGNFNFKQPFCEEQKSQQLQPEEIFIPNVFHFTDIKIFAEKYFTIFFSLALQPQWA